MMIVNTFLRWLLHHCCYYGEMSRWFLGVSVKGSCTKKFSCCHDHSQNILHWDEVVLYQGWDRKAKTVEPKSVSGAPHCEEPSQRCTRSRYWICRCFNRERQSAGSGLPADPSSHYTGSEMLRLQISWTFKTAWYSGFQRKCDTLHPIWGPWGSNSCCEEQS